MPSGTGICGLALVHQVENTDAERHRGIAHQIRGLEVRRENAALAQARRDPCYAGKPALVEPAQKRLDLRVVAREELPGLPVGHEQKEARDEVAAHGTCGRSPERLEKPRHEDARQPDSDRLQPLPRSERGKHARDQKHGEESDADPFG